MQTIVQNDIFSQMSFLEAEEEKLAKLARKLLCSDAFNLHAKETKKALTGIHPTSLGVLVTAVCEANVAFELRQFDALLKVDAVLVPEHLALFLRELLSPHARRGATASRGIPSEGQGDTSLGIFAPWFGTVVVVGEDTSAADDTVTLDPNGFTALCRRHVEQALDLVAKEVTARAVNVLTAVVMEVAGRPRKRTGDDPDGARHERIRKAVQRSTRTRAKK